MTCCRNSRLAWYSHPRVVAGKSLRAVLDGCMGLHYGLWWTNQWTAWNNYAQLGQQLECNPLGGCHGAMNGSITHTMFDDTCMHLFRERERREKNSDIYYILRYKQMQIQEYTYIYYIYVDTDMDMNWYGDRDGSKPLYAWWTSIYVVFNICSSTQTWYL